MMKKIAFTAVGLLATCFACADRATVHLKNRSVRDLMAYTASDRFPVEHGAVLVSFGASKAVDLSGPDKQVEAAVKAIAAWDVRPDVFEVHFVWRTGDVETRPVVRCPSRQQAEVRWGETGLAITPWYSDRVKCALTLDAKGRRFTTLIPCEDALLTFTKNRKGKIVVQVTSDGKAAGELAVGDDWSDLVGSSLAIDTKLVQLDEKP